MLVFMWKDFQTGHYSLQVLGDDACIGFCVHGDMIARYLKVSKISFGQDAPVPVLLRWKFCNALSMGKEHDRTCIRKRFVRCMSTPWACQVRMKTDRKSGDSSSDFLSVFIRTWQAHGVLMHQYKPLPYAGPVVFFSHTERIAEFPTEQHRHWRVLTKGDFRHFQIPGNHISMNAKPNAGVIAQHLKTIMSCLEILSHEYKH